LDHGTDPEAASYAYVLLPGADPARTKRRAADRHWLKILANSADQQAVAVPSLGFVGANFFAAGAVGGLHVDRPASVMVRVADGRATVCVSDPQQNADTVRLTWDGPGRIGEVVSKDPTVTVV